MLDNGAWEYGHAISDDDIVAWARKTCADEIILPDKLFDKEYTIRRHKVFLETCADSHHKYAMVPQGKDIQEWIACYKEMIVLFPSVDVICIPKWLESKFHNRQGAMWILRKEGMIDLRPHHLFGLETLSELDRLVIGYRSIDTIKPISYAYRGKVMHPDMNYHVKRPPKNAKPSSSTDFYVAKNVMKMSVRCHRQ